MKYKTKYSFLFSIGLILYFILKDSNLVFKNTIPLLFTIGSSIYFSKYLKFKENSSIYLIILIVILILPTIIMVNQNLDYLFISEIFDGIVLSVICFILNNYFIYE